MTVIGRHFRRVLQDRYDPEHWWNRAENARARAAEMSNEGSRRVLVSIARSYDLMAEWTALSDGWQRRTPRALSQSD
jgi:uncharacterized protein (DUF4415 family)